MTLSTKQRVFIDEYLKTFNATDAARKAGYSENAAAVIGHQNLRKLNIAAEIERRLSELTMSTNEALIRLTEQGRGAQTEHITSSGMVDIAGLKTAGLGHLIKGVKEGKYGKIVEFHDAQAAIDKILRVRGAYVDRHELSGPNGGPVQHEHKGQVHGSVEHIAAVFATLAEVGILQLPGQFGGGAAEDDELHPGNTDA